MAFSPVIRLNKRRDTVCAIRKKVEAIFRTLNSLWQVALLSVGMVITVIGASMSAGAQAVVLNPSEILPELTANEPSVTIFYINGMRTHGLNVGETIAAGGHRPYSSSGATKLILSLLALRMADAGIVDLDATLSVDLPGVIPPSPFNAPITAQHLLQETGGFASPPQTLKPKSREQPVEEADLRKFVISMRSPGQASSHDPVGWAILVTLLEQKDGKPLRELIDEYLSVPLALDRDNITVGYQSLSGNAMPVTTEMSLTAFAEIVRPLIRNLNHSGELFLSRSTHAALVSGQDGFSLHPKGTIVSNGMTIDHHSGFTQINGLNADCAEPLAFTAFPDQGVAFIAAFGEKNKRNEPSICAPNLVRTSGLKIAEKYFPPRGGKDMRRQQLARPSKLEGRYILANQSPAGLAERLSIMTDHWLSVYGHTGEKLLLSDTGQEPIVYLEAGPYAYQTDDAGAPAPRILFSPFRLGGYIALEDASSSNRLYRRVDSLGRTAMLLGLLPWALLLIASGGLYAFRPATKSWRNMGLFALVGAALVGAGLYFEITSWATVLYEKNQPGLIIAWRTGLNIGLMLLLALPMFVFSFARSKIIPTTGAKLLVGPHLALIAAAALVVFLTLVMWGVAGTFAPY